ncbi:hypothetical protein P7K49_001404 [Saguinus oedipus]|uniref:Uncharacterized protein n=1 Tax=Saguinus oedipus TaxID=9490 RepID=A0ABQ9WEG5_SAGOE|nr:hypothetical protein P7K49_001404 [Saguinus oedipus]
MILTTPSGAKNEAAGRGDKHEKLPGFPACLTVPRSMSQLVLSLCPFLCGSDVTRAKLEDRRARGPAVPPSSGEAVWWSREHARTQVLISTETRETQTSSSTMSYRRELEKYRDLDEDEILGALTEEELRTLENELDELDPDGSWVPGPIGLHIPPAGCPPLPDIHYPPLPATTRWFPDEAAQVDQKSALVISRAGTVRWCNWRGRAPGAQLAKGHRIQAGAETWISKQAPECAHIRRKVIEHRDVGASMGHLRPNGVRGLGKQLCLQPRIPNLCTLKKSPRNFLSLTLEKLELIMRLLHLDSLGKGMLHVLKNRKPRTETLPNSGTFHNMSFSPKPIWGQQLGGTTNGLGQQV